jgi:hypothetical protein
MMYIGSNIFRLLILLSIAWKTQSFDTRTRQGGRSGDQDWRYGSTGVSLAATAQKATDGL